MGVILIGLLLLATGCGGLESQIVGRWQGSADTIEFFSDGTVTIADPLMPLTGTYSFVDDNRVRIELGGLGALAGPFIVTVAISGDTLSLTGPDGSTDTYTRLP